MSPGQEANSSATWDDAHGPFVIYHHEDEMVLSELVLYWDL